MPVNVVVIIMIMKRSFLLLVFILNCLPKAVRIIKVTEIPSNLAVNVLNFPFPCPGLGSLDWLNEFLNTSSLYSEVYVDEKLQGKTREI